MPLAPEDVAQRVAAELDPEFSARRRGLLRELPPVLKDLLRAVGSRPEAESTAAEADRKRALGGALDQLPGEARRLLFDAMFLELGEAVAHWWVDGQAQPWLRPGSIRAPGHPEVTAASRVHRLDRLFGALSNWPGDPLWLAAWAGYLVSERDGLGPGQISVLCAPVLAAALDCETVGLLEVIRDCVFDRHPVGRLDYHLTRALQLSHVRAGWEVLAELLSNEELPSWQLLGLITDADSAHPEVFRLIAERLLRGDRLALEPVAREVSRWTGTRIDADLSTSLARYLEFREDPVARRHAVDTGDSGEVWSRCTPRRRRTSSWPTTWPSSPTGAMIPSCG